jgi:hypothetical protein
MTRIHTLLVLFAGIGCTGCYIPVISPTHPSAAVGPAGSAASLRVGTATRADVTARFGTPRYSKENDRIAGYVLPIKTAVGFGFGPCCAPGLTEYYDYENLWLEFDRRGVLKGYVAGDDAARGDWIQLFSHDSDAGAPHPTTQP